MFHTFQSSAGPRSSGADSDGQGKPTRAAGSRRISTSNACVECRRRKIRCDGTQPCGQCQWYQHPDACSYSKPAQRVVPSRKLVDKLSNNVEQYKSVLTKLYGVKNLEALALLPREELLELALSSSPSTNLTTSPSTADAQASSEHHFSSDAADDCEALEQDSSESPSWDEVQKHMARRESSSDDATGASMPANRLFSYVGISSTRAVFEVIVQCAPQARSLIAHNVQETVLPNQAASPPLHLTNDRPDALPQLDHGQGLLESYFDRIHPFLPIIDERKFWSTYMYSNRTDSPWLGLLNMVFALGSLASSTADNQAHYIYFNRSRQHLSLESFGSGNLEVLQALAIMGGYYMHYLNRPREAHSLMGGTLRMATTLGLHREYSEQSDTDRQLLATDEEDSVSPEMRRRIWWSLFCLDAWASSTTGRPSLGSMGPSISVLRPGTGSQNMHIIPPPNSPQYIDQLKILPLIHASAFCQIATRIQDRLLECPVLSLAETASYDAQVMQWYEGLPSVLSNIEEACPEFLHRVRLIMKWRFQSIRIILHRPILLTTALRRNSSSMLSTDERVAIEKCRALAHETIEDISQECMPDIISGSNAVWFCFQACMVPLVSLFSDPSVPEEVEKWKSSIETTLQFLDSVKDWSITAKRSGEVIAQLYIAYKTQISAMATPQANQPVLSPQQQGHSLPEAPSAMFAPPMLSPQSAYGQGRNAFHYDPATPPWANVHDPMVLNNFWDGMMWDTGLPDMLETPFEASNEYGFTSAASDPSSSGACWIQGN